MEDALSQLLSGLKGKPKQNRKLIKLPLEWTSLSSLMPEFLEREVILKNKGCDSWAPSKLNYAVPAFQSRAFDSYDQFSLEVVDQWPSGLKLSDFVSGLKDIRFALIMRSKRIDVALAFYGTKMNCEDGQEKVLQRQLDLSDYVKQMVLVNDPFVPEFNELLLEKISDLQSSLTELQEINKGLISDKKKLEELNQKLEKEKADLEAKKAAVTAVTTQVVTPVTPVGQTAAPITVLGATQTPKGSVLQTTTTAQGQSAASFLGADVTKPVAPLTISTRKSVV